MNRLVTGLLSVAAALAAPGCGLEGLLHGFADTDHVLDVSVIKGTTANEPTSVEVLQPDGSKVALIDADIEGSSFTLQLPSAVYSNLRVVATQGELRLDGVVTALEENGEAQVDLTRESTTGVLIVETALSANEKTLQVVEPKVLAAQLAQLSTAFAAAEDSAPKTLLAMVGRIFDKARADGSARPIKTPHFDRDYAAVESTLDLAWLGTAGVDYDGDGTMDTTSDTFDAELGRAARTISLDGCLNQEVWRVVFEVDFNDARLDGNCDRIQRFRWVRDEPGKSMWFVGGFHMESPIQDPELDATMGNRGGWVPNIIAMSDDGTNADAAAGDNIWTISFELPRNARIGYKYTWGKQGDLWTGSEEWPGNQHILEIADVNGDNIVYRRDNFGDEATNKDRVNLNRRGNGTVTWDTDANGDGIPDSRERPLDIDLDCTLDEWVTPTGIGPATVDCESVGGQ